jgi:alcohol dehydrogenase YqhD (iron-dependent ADH family)
MIMANDFTFFSPTKVVFGKGTEAQTGREIREFGGTRALVVYGSDRVIRTGLMGRVLDSLDREGIGHVELGGVVPNPHLDLVYEGIRLGLAEHVDFLLAIGGGSPIDTAKAIAYGIAEPEKDVWEIFDAGRVPEACLPIGCVLTIAAAGSELSNSSVITNEKKQKRGSNHDICRPKFTIMNPELTMSLPDWQTQNGCVDIQMHTMERYFTSKGNMKITDSFAEGLMKTVMEQALVLHQDPANYDARAEVMWAGSLAHNGITGCGNGGNDFVTHRLGQELGGLYDVTHGASLSAVWGSWARYVYKNCLDRFVLFAVRVHGITPQATEEETALRGIEAQERFYREIGMPTSIRELDIDPTEEEIRWMAKDGVRKPGGSLGAAMTVYEEDLYRIFKAAL